MGRAFWGAPREKGEPGRVAPKKQKAPTKQLGRTFLRALIYYVSAALVKQNFTEIGSASNE
jgi:hypothetical protein